MQRVAALYDIHGNLPALEAVLDEVRQAQVDAIVIGGDVLPGPMPRECLESLRATGIPLECIYGNGETTSLEARRGGTLEAVPETFRAGIRFSAAQLPDEDAAAIAAWPLTTRLTIDGLGEVLFCHATPRNATEIFTRLSPEERISTMFAGVDNTLAVCGHTHMQFDRTVGSLRIVNAGSVGMPFGEPAAYWLLLGPDVQFNKTTYDREIAATRIRLTSYPGVADFVARSVLHPPSEEEMLALYAKADGRA
jgi:predicted phosphodiesterase